MKFGITRQEKRTGSDMDILKRRISTIFDDFFNVEPTQFFDNDWIPALDVEEDPKSICIKADMPGVEEKDLNVSYQNGILTITGERASESKEGSGKSRKIISERSYGCFSRSISLPDGVQADKIKAEFKKGVLTVTVPRARVEEPKKITINVQ